MASKQHSPNQEPFQRPLIVGFIYLTLPDVVVVVVVVVLVVVVGSEKGGFKKVDKLVHLSNHLDSENCKSRKV